MRIIMRKNTTIRGLPGLSVSNAGDLYKNDSMFIHGLTKQKKDQLAEQFISICPKVIDFEVKKS